MSLRLSLTSLALVPYLAIGCAPPPPAEGSGTEEGGSTVTAEAGSLLESEFGSESGSAE